MGRGAAVSAASSRSPKPWGLGSQYMNDRARKAMEFSNASRSPRSRSPRWEENKRRVLGRGRGDSPGGASGGGPVSTHLTDSFHSSAAGDPQMARQSFSSEDTSLAGALRGDRQDLSSLAYVPEGPQDGPTGAADGAAQGYPGRASEPAPHRVEYEEHEEHDSGRMPVRPARFRHQDSHYADPMNRMNGHGK